MTSTQYIQVKILSCILNVTLNIIMEYYTPSHGVEFQIRVEARLRLIDRLIEDYCLF